MIANYHTHTWRCGHAVGTEQEYAEAALAAGIRVLGFSDHAPYPFCAGYRSTFRMLPEQLHDYCQTILALRREYDGVLDMPLGLEAEYYPAFFSDFLDLLAEEPLDYLILGQHYLGSEIGDFYCGWETDEVHLLTRYVRQCAEAMNKGCFSYLAHPDLFHFTGDRAVYQREMRTLCREANSCKLPLEWNLLGQAGGRHYPNEAFWEVAAEENCAVVLGRDAHDPEVFADAETEREARKKLAALGLHPLEQLTLRPIF